MQRFSKPLSRSWFVPAVLLVTAITIVLSFVQFNLPASQPSSAPADAFSAERAYDVLAGFATEPHPTGTQAAADTRAYLIDQLTELGLSPEIQSAVGALDEYGVVGRAENVVARLSGTDSTGAVLLIAHYDTVQPSPGASDNGSGVVTILETFRAMQDDLPLKNDLIILFNDAEEYGTLGAQAFAAEHPWAEDVAVVLNIEGAMNGPNVLIETGLENGWFVREFYHASPRPYGFSWVYDLYLILPYLTDFTPFKDAGLAGGNLFGYNGGPEYHTPHDNLAHVTMCSLQHHGDQTLALTRHFANADLASTHAPDVVYFNLLGPLFIIYPGLLVIPFAALGLILFVAVLVIGLRRGRLTWGGMGIGLLVLLLGIVASTLVVMGVWQVIRWLHPIYDVYFPTGHFYNDIWYMVGAVALSVAVITLVYQLVGKKRSWADRAFGALWFWLVLVILTALFLPGFSYLFVWPFIITLLALGAFFLSPAATADESLDPLFSAPLYSGILMLLGLALALLLWVPVLSILYAGTALGFLMAVPAVVGLLIGIMLLSLSSLLATQKPLFPALAGIAALAIFVGGSLTAGFDAENPRPTRVRYFSNADTGETFWVNASHDLSEWEQQFVSDDAEVMSFSEIFPPWSSSVLPSPAPDAGLAAPVVDVLENSSSGEKNVLEVQVSSSRQAEILIFAVAPGTEVQDFLVDGQPAFTDDALAGRALDTWLIMQYVSPAEEGITVRLEVPGTQEQVEFLVSDWRMALPEDVMPITPRPDDVFTLGDESFVFQQFEISVEQ